MYRPQILFRIQLVVLVATGVLSLVYLLLYQPLTRHEAQRDQALAGLHEQLRSVNARYQQSLGMDPEIIQGNRRLAEKTLAALQDATQRINERISLAQEWRDRINRPFQLLDFDQKRQQLIDELQQAARAKGVALDPSVPGAYPEHRQDQTVPAQLWAALFVTDQILLTVVANQVKTIKTAMLLPIQTHSSNDAGRTLLDEYSLRLEMAGTAESLANFLRSLPWRPGELKNLSLPVSSDAKPALFLNRFILKRDLADPNGVHLDAIITGLVAREAPPS